MIGMMLICRKTDQILLFIMLIPISFLFCTSSTLKWLGYEVIKIFIAWYFNFAVFWRSEFFNSLLLLSFLFWKYLLLHLDFSMISLMIVSLLQSLFDQNLLIICYHIRKILLFCRFFSCAYIFGLLKKILVLSFLQVIH